MSNDILHQPIDDSGENPDDKALTSTFEMAEPLLDQPIEPEDEGEPEAQVEPVEAGPAPTGEAPVEEQAKPLYLLGQGGNLREDYATPVLIIVSQI